MKRKKTSRKNMFKKRSYRSKLNDKKINTLVEKRISEIAKTEANKARKKSYKDYSVGVYDNYGCISDYHHLTDRPSGCFITIHKVASYNPSTSPSTVSKRIGDTIWVRGFKIEGVLNMESSNSNITDIDCKLALIRVKRPEAPQTTHVMSELPTPILYNDLNGGRPMIEQEVDQTNQVQLLGSRVLRLRPKGKIDTNKHFTWSVWFKRPQKNMFAPSDTSGDNPLLYSYWFVAFTDTDTSSNPDSKAQFICNVRKYYFQE